MMDINLEGKVALVCGSTRGIGKAIAVEYAKCGASVILLSRNKAKLQNVLKDLPNHKGQQHDFLAADFTSKEEVIMKVEQLLLERKIDILVNNTGGPAPGNITDTDTNQLTEAFKQHVVINQELTRLVLSGMKEKGFGRIINIISTSVREPIPGLGVSNTIRGAVANWAKTLSKEVAQYGITVNNILPGSTNTDRLKEIIKKRAEEAGTNEEEIISKMHESIPTKRFAKAEEIAFVANFLASKYADYITGINIAVDGGKSAGY